MNSCRQSLKNRPLWTSQVRPKGHENYMESLIAVPKFAPEPVQDVTFSQSSSDSNLKQHHGGHSLQLEPSLHYKLSLGSIPDDAELLGQVAKILVPATSPCKETIVQCSIYFLSL